MGTTKAYSFETKTSVPPRLIRRITGLLDLLFDTTLFDNNNTQSGLFIMTNTDAPPRMIGLFDLLFDTTLCKQQ